MFKVIAHSFESNIGKSVKINGSLNASDYFVFYGHKHFLVANVEFKNDTQLNGFEVNCEQDGKINLTVIHFKYY